VAAFQAQLAAEKAEREAAERAAREIAGGSKKREAWARQEVSGRALWFWTGVPSAIAAGLAIVLTLHLVNRPMVETPILIVQTQSGAIGGGGAGGGSSGGGIAVAGMGGGNDIHLVNQYEIRPKPDEQPLKLPPMQLGDPYKLP
jgi:hypothetical protein